MNRQILIIRDRYAEVQIAPEWGAELTRYHYGDLTAGVRHPILWPWDVLDKLIEHAG